MRLADVIAVLDELYPPALAESWDSVGLISGDPDQPVRHVHLALDPTAQTVAEAIASGADLLLTHHPLLLRGASQIPSTTSKGQILRAAIKNDLALFNAHTNADRARDGVNDALADAVGLRDTTPLVPANELRLEKIVTFVPHDDASKVIDALADAGAGAIGDYSRCAFLGTGVGTFTPGEAANPAIGERGRAEEVPETRVEMVLEPRRRTAVIEALRAAHPYEEPAFDLLAMVPLPTDQGLGRVGELATPMTLRTFTAHLAGALPAAPVGIRAAGDPDREIRRVAVLGGSGDSHLADAARARVDAYVTADLRHHPASEHLADGGPALVDAGHWATESTWLPLVARILTERLGPDLQTSVSEICTDPWTVRA
ncbi:Nif3-like dinuclear metal center hexameric protein [Blastococcus sp. Marseille-P5729]|uniref:Nif3-like dinuclear metal center hexameric protein n=1 Tax=Blastococcus sp. Marseille-P5729 TaxID=2086582 RepID=UPI0018FE86B3|nr:Nif3-like dinuclear metal center hexameric protein [Blastococcus sp. Marseille-P5729]